MLPAPPGKTWVTVYTAITKPYQLFVTQMNIRASPVNVAERYKGRLTTPPPVQIKFENNTVPPARFKSRVNHTYPSKAFPTMCHDEDMKSTKDSVLTKLFAATENIEARRFAP